MKITFYIFLVVIIFFSSCNAKDPIKKTLEASQDSLVYKDVKKQNKLHTKLNLTAKKAVSNWKEYQILNEFIQQYKLISYSEALSNATELSELATHLKDSIALKKLKTPSVKTRLNILQNECLRLKDMEDIPAITPQEVTNKVVDIIAAYAAVNAKFNSVYQINEMENELELDPDFEKILLESAIDTINPPKPIVKNPPKRKKYNKKLVHKKRSKNLISKRKKKSLSQQQ